MKWFAASLGLLLVGAEGKRFETSSAIRKGNVETVEFFEEQVRVADGMTDEEYAKEHGLTHGQYEPCPAERASHLPFVVTDIEGVHDEETGQLRYGYHSARSPVSIYFLTDVTFCEATTFSPYVITGTKVSGDEFKAAVNAYLEENGLHTVLYSMHGFANDPEASWSNHGMFFYTKYRETMRWLNIPVMWRNAWGSTGGSYEYDRNGPAIRGGKLFAEFSDAFDAPYTTYILCHSMGNWVFQNMAMEMSERGTSKILFDKFFMVAADARADMFQDDYNPDAPRTEKEKALGLKDVYDSDGDMDIMQCTYDETTGKVSVGAGLGIPIEECRLNGGYDITKIAEKVHVVWNDSDTALYGRSYLQLSPTPGLTLAIGRYADAAQEGMSLEYFASRVTFSPNMKGLVDGGMMDHSYYKELAAVQEYEPQLNAECRWTGCSRGGCDDHEIELFVDGCWLNNSEYCCVLSMASNESELKGSSEMAVIQSEQ